MTNSSNIEPAANRTVEGLNAVFGPASPAAIFSAPERLDDQLVITAASWERAGGFGFGGGAGTDATGNPEGGGGGGGGGTSVGRPVAVITVGADGIRVEPVIDLTKLAVTALLSALGVWRALR
ncbi:MAG: hypothetical protein GY778_07655 [bacterium]|nr:hypothetical protein [bacterium]